MIGRDNYINQLIGNYQIVNMLGSGSFGTVYLARNRHVAEYTVAIKLMNTAYVSSQQERESFIREASLLVKLKHPGILPIHDFGILDSNTYESMPYMVTEYAANGSLRQRLQNQSSQPLPLSEALIILSQVGQALHFAHRQNIVHRDLKPENILFNVQGEALLADFGIATEMPTSTIRNNAAIIGTPPYMAPEQFEGTVSKLSDQYALGCIAYELVTGRKPFTARDFVGWAAKHANEPPIPPRQLNPSLPEHIEQAILKTMAKERTQRHSDVAAFTTALSLEPPIPPPPPPLHASTISVLISPSSRIELGPTALTIGRAPDNQRVIEDSQVSGHHAVIRPEGQGYTITDLKSTNHTFVNGQQLTPHVSRLLNSGDTIRMGRTTFTYEVSSAPQIAETEWVKPKQEIAKTVWVEPPENKVPEPVPPKPQPIKPLPSDGRTPKRTRWIVAVISIVVLILIGVVLIPTVSGNVQIANDHATATAQTLNVQATADASNATATATAAQDLYNSATSGTPALNDPLSDNSNNNRWSEGSNCQFTGGSYHASVAHQGGYIQPCPANATNFSNFAYQVQMTIDQGDEGCLVFRSNFTSSTDSYYSFCISSSDSYKFIIKLSNVNTYNTLKQNSSSAVTTGQNQTNVVTVVAQGAELNMYVNNQFVLTMNDSNITEGSIGVGALDDSNSTDVAFSNAKVWTL